jgi:hypothetical protein
MGNIVKLPSKALWLTDLEINTEYVDNDGHSFVFMGMSRYHKHVGKLEGAADYDGIGVVPLKDQFGPFKKR